MEVEIPKDDRERLAHGLTLVSVYLPIIYAGGNPLFPPFNIDTGPPAVMPAKAGPFQPLLFPANEAGAY